MPPVVLFLDFDGVIAGEAFVRRQRQHPEGRDRIFDPLNLAALDQLCRRLSVSAIVVTSTWRIGRSVAVLRQLLASEGFEQTELIIDVTPDLGPGIGSRRAEIAEWIAGHGSAIRPLILDDCDLGIPEGFFQIDGWTGLTAATVDRVAASFG